MTSQGKQDKTWFARLTQALVADSSPRLQLCTVAALVKMQVLLSLVRQQKAAAVLFRHCTELQGPFSTLPFTLHAWLCELCSEAFDIAAVAAAPSPDTAHCWARHHHTVENASDISHCKFYKQHAHGVCSLPDFLWHYCGSSFSFAGALTKFLEEE